MIYLDNVSYRYRRKDIYPALSGISARLGAGVHLLLGANGAGKTTLLNIIGGADFPTQGTCVVADTDTRLRCPSQLSQVSMMSTGMRMPGRNVADMVSRHARFYPTFSPDVLASNLKAFGIGMKEPLGNMSLGTSNKAAVAYVLALQTPVVLLDEPANGLDIDSKVELQKMVVRCMRPDMCCIVSTHTVADLQNLYDGVIILEKGRLVLCMSIDELLRRVTFVSSAQVPADALGYHTVAGRVVSIVAADSPSLDSCAETEVDYALLYLAMRDDNNVKLKELLQS